MHKSEIYTTATVAGAWLAHVWNDYLMPMLQGGLVLLTFVAAVLMVWNRYLENKLKRRELQKIDEERSSSE